MKDWPRVTAILKDVGLGPDLSMVPPATLAAAMARGTAVHDAVEGLVYGYLDESQVPPDAAPYVSAFRKFLADARCEPIAAEVSVEHAAWRYRGRADLVAWLNGRRVLIDAKTGASDGAEYQVAGYAEAWNHQRPTEAVVAGAVLHLRGDGTFRFEEINLSAATQVWLAAVVVYQARHRA